MTTLTKFVEDVLTLPIPDPGRPKPISLPFGSLGTLFKGRQEVLAQLRKSLSRSAEGHTTAIVGTALHGMGGVGKTRLAVEYAWQHKDDYSALLFVSAESPQSLRHNLAGLSGPLVLNLSENNLPDEEVRLAATLRWLRERPGWLLILDNVDTPESATAIEDLLTRLHGGQVLITSRLMQWGRSTAPLQLDVLTERDAAAFLLERTQRTRRKLLTDAAEAAELARELGGLALGLEQAAAFIAVHRISLVQYRERWRNQESRVLEWVDQREMKYPRSVAVTWQTTMEQLGEGETALLRLLSWMAPEPVPLFVLEGDAAAGVWREGVTFLEQASPAVVSVSGQITDALAILSNYSMVRWHVEMQTVSVHCVLQEILRAGLPEADQKAWLALSLRLLDVARPGDPTDVRSWPRWSLLRPHVASVVQRADQAGIPEPTARLMNDLGLLLAAKALHAKAEPLLRRALAIKERGIGAEHPEVAIALDNLAQLLQATNRTAEAEPLLRRALAIDERSFGVDHPNVAIRLNNLAQLLRDNNRPAEAEPLMRRVVGIFETSLGEDHPNVASALHNLGELLRDTNRLAEAEPLMRSAVASAERSFGADHPQVATDLNNLAGLLRDTNRLAEAEPLMRRVAGIFEKNLGEDHPDVANALSNLAGLLQLTNRLAEAEPLMRRALAIDEHSFGADHPNVATDLNNLAQLLQATNRLAEAEPLMRRALAIAEQCFGSDHPNVAIHLNNLAQLLLGTNRLAEAEPLMRRALAIDEHSFGSDHPNLARDLNNLVQLLQATNRLAEAEPLMRRALTIDEQSFGSDHPNLAIRLNNLARFLQATNRLAEAQQQMHRAVGILLTFTNQTGHSHPHLETIFDNYASLLQEMGQSATEVRQRLNDQRAEYGLPPE